MYLVSTVFKKSKTGGKRHCQVFYTNGVNLSEVTDQVAEIFNMIYKNGSIVVHCGSGTGYMVIDRNLRTNGTNNIDSSIRVNDVSVLYQ